jgi:hypothetical protein
MAKTDPNWGAVVLKEAIGARLTEPEPQVRAVPTGDGQDTFIEFVGLNAHNLAYLFRVWADENHVFLFQVAPFEFKVLSPLTADHVLGVPYFTEASA